jgi:hypothetical protein
MIQPNDLLLLVGEPAVLESVYRSIKRELGQFPEPFGTNILLYIDMNLVEHKRIKALLHRALYIHEQFQHDLVIKVVNPSNIELLEYIKECRCETVTVNIDYDSLLLEEHFLHDVKQYHAGLVIVSKEMFANHHIRKILYKAHIPVLKLAEKSLSKIKEAAVILADNKDLEKISSTIFDISEQMHLKLELYNYMKEHQKQKMQVIEHYNNLSTIFSKSIKVFQEDDNPIRILKKKENFIHIAPFSEKLIQRRIFALLSTDSEKLYFKLDEYHQIFIPIQL